MKYARKKTIHKERGRVRDVEKCACQTEKKMFHETNITTTAAAAATVAAAVERY